MIPFLDLTRLHAGIRRELDAAFDRVVGSSAFVGGREVAAFEEAFAAAHGRAGAAGCGSGTDALVLALRALGVGPGDEVVVPAFTFVATAEAVVHAGATPVLADVDPVSLLLDPAAVEAVRTARTKAVVPVHLYGHVVSFAHLRAWREAGLLVVEDAAQAHLATWHDEPVGTVGHAACFSFYPGKNLGALGDGGMVCSDDVELIAEVRRLRDHGSPAKYQHTEVGWCSRLDGLQAALLAAKLGHLAEWTEGRRAAAAVYAAGMPEGMLVPWGAGAVHHLLVVRSSDREALAAALRDEAVGTGIHYPHALSQLPALAPWARRPAPVAEAAAAEVLSLPMDPLLSVEEAERVCALVQSATDRGIGR